MIINGDANLPPFSYKRVEDRISLWTRVTVAGAETEISSCGDEEVERGDLEYSRVISKELSFSNMLKRARMRPIPMGKQFQGQIGIENEQDWYCHEEECRKQQNQGEPSRREGNLKKALEVGIEKESELLWR